jgi:hypothetical protein
MPLVRIVIEQMLAESARSTSTHAVLSYPRSVMPAPGTGNG